MTEHQDSEQLKQAIAALEAQRALLGDVVVETSIAALRKQLTELEAQQTAEQTRKQVTVLFADLSGFTAMSEALDAEDVNEVMNALWIRLDKVIVDHGGTIDKHMGDAVMALWGAESAREDDPERAIRAALAMQKEVSDFGLRFSELVTKLKRQDNLAPKIGMRIGINTGPVLLGDVGTTGEFSALGDTVNIASRLEQAAPISKILIAHDTYRHVRGVFDVAAQEPLKIKGKADTIQTYIIQRAKPRIFRMATRGIEGIQTRFIGRDAELEQLQNVFQQTQAHQTARMITVVGEAGIGKSRLLHEFNLRLGLTPDNTWLFQGRASTPMRQTPFALLRDLFATHFQIQDSDSATIAHEKLAQGIREYVGADKEEYAHFIGHLLGLDFSKSPYLRGILSDAQQIRNRAFYYLTQFINAVHARAGNPIVAQLDDIHWADSGSLDAIDHIVQECHTIPLFIICLARPVLLETQPAWDKRGDYHTRIDLQPLSQEDSNRLVDEILQKLDEIPKALREMITSGAEGNPFYLEELIKMLIEDGVILKGQKHWRVDAPQLATVKVPPTLTGILQARLDSLPSPEQALLQKAAVVGRVFWNTLVAQLDVDITQRSPTSQAQNIAEVNALLMALSERELIFKRQSSAFAGAQEFIFKHTILHEVTYETVLKRLRRVYHKQIAQWLEAHSGERIQEMRPLIAEHYERAGENAQAAAYCQQAGEHALNISAYRQAQIFFEQALSLLSSPPDSLSLDDVAPSPSKPQTELTLHLKLGETYSHLSDFDVATDHLDRALTIAHQLNDPAGQANTLYQLSQIATSQGDYAQAQTSLSESLAFARAAADQAALARVLYGLGDTAWRLGKLDDTQRYIEESLNIARIIEDATQVLYALNRLGALRVLQQDFDTAQQLWEECLTLASAAGNRERAAVALANLGMVAHERGDFVGGKQHVQAALEIFKKIGQREFVAFTLLNLCSTNIKLGNLNAAWRDLHKGLALAQKLGALPWVLSAVTNLAQLQAATGNIKRALGLLGLVLHHPVASSDIKREINTVLTNLNLDQGTVDAGLAQGKTLDLDEVVAEVLAEFDRSSNSVPNPPYEEKRFDGLAKPEYNL